MAGPWKGRGSGPRDPVEARQGDSRGLARFLTGRWGHLKTTAVVSQFGRELHP